MANRTLVEYEEDRLPDGPHWILNVERSAGGQPGLFFTIRTETAGVADRHIETLNRELTVFVKDGNALLAPVLEWLNEPRNAAFERLRELSNEIGDY